jgi:ferredoxin-NADP reductase
VFIPIISGIWEQLDAENAQRVVFRAALFSNQNSSSTGSFKLDHHRHRLSAEFFVKEPSLSDARERDVLICGTPEFEQVAISGLGEIGVSPDSIRREKYTY